jgi:hypothetical protein
MPSIENQDEQASTAKLLAEAYGTQPPGMREPGVSINMDDEVVLRMNEGWSYRFRSQEAAKEARDRLVLAFGPAEGVKVSTRYAEGGDTPVDPGSREVPHSGLDEGEAIARMHPDTDVATAQAGLNRARSLMREADRLRAVANLGGGVELNAPTEESRAADEEECTAEERRQDDISTRLSALDMAMRQNPAQSMERALRNAALVEHYLQTGEVPDGNGASPVVAAKGTTLVNDRLVPRQ